MKRIIVLTLSVICLFNMAVAQDKYATAESGERVILHSNGKWEYITEAIIKEKFVEPKGDPKNQKSLKATDATVADMKKHVSVDLDCPIENIILLKLSEQKGNAIYDLEACGRQIRYRRTGSVFFKDGENPLENIKMP